MSLGVPSRPIGMPRAALLVLLLPSVVVSSPPAIAFDSLAIPSVPAIAPGAMQFEMTPRGPCSMATAAERASTPALATVT